MKKSRAKKTLLFALHFNYITGIIYALAHFLTSPKTTMMEVRRLWAYEVWIIFSFYLIFIYLNMLENESRGKKIKVYLKRIKEILSVNLLLLIFPWGLFLLLGPSQLMAGFGLNSVYWRVLGAMSLVGAVVYALPYFSYREKLSYYIYLFGVIDNFLAGLIVAVLFVFKKVPIITLGSVPLLFYFSYFFLIQARYYRRLFKKFR